MITHLAAGRIGMSIVLISHVVMLANRPTRDMQTHALINMFAVVLIAYRFVKQKCCCPRRSEE